MIRAGKVDRIVPNALLEAVELGAWKFVLLKRLKNSARYHDARTAFNLGESEPLSALSAAE